MLLRFYDVPRDASALSETGFLDRRDSPRVVELFGRQASVEAAYKRTGTRAVQSAIQGQARALMGALVFSADEDADEMFLRRMAERWETDFLQGLSRFEHYEILWHHLNWGAGHELRFFLPLWNKVDQAPFAVPKQMIDRSDLWTRVQALTFGLQDPFPRHRAGIRPGLQLSDRGPNKTLKAALTAYVEEAIMAGEFRSRGAGIADLGKIGFEVAKEEPQALTVRYAGADADLVQKARKPIMLTGPAFSDSFGLIDDPKIVELQDAVKAGLKRLRDEAEAQSARLAPGIEKAIQDAADLHSKAALKEAGPELERRLGDFKQQAEQVVDDQRIAMAFSLKTGGEEVDRLRRNIAASVEGFNKATKEGKDALVAEAMRELAASAEAIKIFTKNLEEAKKDLRDLGERKDRIIKRLTYGLVAAGCISALLLIPTVYFSTRHQRMLRHADSPDDDISQQKAQLDVLAGQTAEELALHRDALTHAVELERQVQEALQGMAQSLTILGDAVRIEEKADGTNALTIYTRKIPSVRNCDRQPGCVARVDTRSN